MKKVVLAALFAVSSPVFAQGYVGIGFGQSSADLDPDPAPAGFSRTVNDTDTSFKVFGGATVNENFGVEVGYIDFGELSVEYSDGSITASDNFALKTLYFALVGNVPIGQANIFAKVGMSSWDLDYSGRSNFGWSASASASGTDPMFGIGVQFNVAEQVAIRAEFERYRLEDNGAKDDVDNLGIAAVIKF